MDSFVSLPTGFARVTFDFFIMYSVGFFLLGGSTKWFIDNFEYTSRYRGRKASSFALISVSVLSFLSLLTLLDDFPEFMPTIPVYAMCLYLVFRRVDNRK